MSYFGSVWNGYTNWWEFNANCFTEGVCGSRVAGVVVGAVSSVVAFLPGLPAAIVVSIVAGMAEKFIDFVKWGYNALPEIRTVGFPGGAVVNNVSSFG